MILGTNQSIDPGEAPLHASGGIVSDYTISAEVCSQPWSELSTYVMDSGGARTDFGTRSFNAYGAPIGEPGNRTP